MMNVAVIGAGYVGLVSGACFAEIGANVVCIDKDERKLALLAQGKSPIYEPGLDEILQTNMAAGRLYFTSDMESAIARASVVFIAVGTPTGEADGRSTDLRYVHGVAKEMAPFLKSGAVVVTKSTVPVGTGEQVRAIIRKARPGFDVHVASNPEFLREGSAVDDFMEPERIVVGTDSDKAAEILRTLYAPLIIKGAHFLNTTVKTAEIIKYAANSFLATKIAFINEMADLCEAAGANVQQVAEGMGLDSRIGRQFLNAGPGFGGSCFPKDIRSLHYTTEQFGVESHIIEAVIHSNETRKQRMVHKIISATENHGKTLAILGAAFKGNTDDIRESPALDVAKGLLKAGYSLRLYDPEALDNAKAFLGDKGVAYADSVEQAVSGADALVILTEWKQFAELDLAMCKRKLSSPLIIDLRNLYAPEIMEAHGFTYISVGRSDVGSASSKAAAEDDNDVNAYNVSYA